MKLVAESSHQTPLKVAAGPARCGHRPVHWSLLMAVGAVGLVLQLPVQAKPIAGCMVQETDLLDPASCVSPPEQFESTRSTSQATMVTQPDRVARVTLDNIDSDSVSTLRSGGGPSSNSSCSALRGTHEAQSLMLQTVQRQLGSIERDRRLAKTALRSLRNAGANKVQLTSAAGRLTKINAVWSALRGDVKARTKRFNNSMSRLTKACLQG
jgi:hypothetical protein